MYEDWIKQAFKEPESLLTIQASWMPWIITIFDPQIPMGSMLKQLTKTFVPIAGVFCFLAVSGLYGQQDTRNKKELRESSMAEFNQGNYRTALSGFRTLLAAGGDDPQISYFTGRCLVELNEELPDAIELLYKASRDPVQQDAVFYLGRAYHLNYNFRDAMSCYERYEKSAGKQEVKKHRVKHLIATCRSAGEITALYNPFEVMNVTFMDLSDSLQFTQVKMKGGDLGLKDEVYFHDDEDRVPDLGEFRQLLNTQLRDRFNPLHRLRIAHQPQLRRADAGRSDRDHGHGDKQNQAHKQHRSLLVSCVHFPSPLTSIDAVLSTNVMPITKAVRAVHPDW